jgi:hypothetical protein
MQLQSDKLYQFSKTHSVLKFSHEGWDSLEGSFWVFIDLTSKKSVKLRELTSIKILTN